MNTAMNFADVVQAKPDEKLPCRCVQKRAADDVLSLRNRALLEVVYSAGLRSSEAVGLDLGDVNFEQEKGEMFREFLDQQGLFVFFVTIYVGAGLIANDRRANALQIYLSKPLTRAEYVANVLPRPKASFRMRSSGGACTCTSTIPRPSGSGTSC